LRTATAGAAGALLLPDKGDVAPAKGDDKHDDLRWMQVLLFFVLLFVLLFFVVFVVVFFALPVLRSILVHLFIFCARRTPLFGGIASFIPGALL
jgi:hypothetical protein